VEPALRGVAAVRTDPRPLQHQRKRGRAIASEYQPTNDDVILIVFKLSTCLFRMEGRLCWGDGWTGLGRSSIKGEGIHTYTVYTQYSYS
jgi:hypothetical protein